MTSRKRINTKKTSPTKKKRAFVRMGKTRITKTVTSIPSARASKFMKTMNMSRSKRFKRRIGGSKRVFGQRGPEIKFIDTVLNLPGTATGNVQCLNLVATGTDNTNRIGRKIDCKSVEVKKTYTYMIDNNAVPCSLTTRWAIVLDKQPNGALPTYAQIYQYNTGGQPWAMRNLDYIERFDVLATDMFTLCPVSNTGLSSSNVQGGGQIACTADVQKFVQLNIGSRYDGTAAAISSLETGAILFIDITQTADGGGDPGELACQGIARVRFLDE